MDSLLREIDLLRQSPPTLRVETPPPINKPTSRTKRKCRFGPRSSKSCTDQGEEIVGSGDIPFIDRSSPSTSYSFQIPQPDIPTLMPPGPSWRTPFDHYKHSAENAPQPDPYRFVHKRLGLTAAEFNAKVTEEINESLRAAQAERCLERIFPPATGNQEPLPRILTKEDCLAFFNATGHPTTGSLLGVWRWAADLGIPRFNLMEDLDEHNLYLINDLD
jgi:hypothetical protein